MSHDIIPRDETPPATSAGDLLKAAIERGIDPAGIETLARVFEQMEARRAEQAFNAALSHFQAECPVILKQTQIDFPIRGGGRFSSRYASMDDIITQTRELRTRHGFSFSFTREVKDKSITVCCILRHEGGHQTSTAFSIPIAQDNKLSDAHAVASAVSFAERYAFRGALGITTGLPDDDGKALTQANAKITAEQVLTLSHLIEETQADIPKFWEFAGVTKDTLDALPATDYARVQQALLQRKRKQQGGP